MDYVCKVVGNLKIPEINLSLTYMEMINLNPEDFKQSPRLRLALKNREIEVYNPQIHKNAKRFKKHISKTVPQGQVKKISDNPRPSSSRDVEDLHISLSKLYKKMDSLVTRVNVLISKTVESTDKLNNNFEKFLTKPQEKEEYPEILDKLTRFLEHSEKNKQENEEKFNKLITKIDELITKGVHFSGTGSNGRMSSITKKSTFNDAPTYVPEIKTDNVKTNIVTKEVKSKGTEDILEKLKQMK
jgi:hypothetical protein